MTLAAPQQTGSARDALDRALPRLRCPVSGRPLKREGHELVSDDGRHRYAIAEAGVPLFAPEPQRPESRIQQRHYDRVAEVYVRHLSLPHTEAYRDYLDGILAAAFGRGSLGYVGELCCGRGEAVRLLLALGARLDGGLGIDISQAMLHRAASEDPDPRFLFVQGDATMLPVADETFDTVVILGGIHHVNDRRRLFAEVVRVLKPGGRLVFREPLNDFFLWRWLRSVIYRVSPNLEEATERPLRERQTRRHLGEAGLRLATWRPCGLLGFCLFMNGDVLVVNRLLRFLPGIRRIARAVARLDDAILRLPLLGRAGLQVVGVAEKPS